MRSKLVLAALLFLSPFPVLAQVAPAAKISSLPLSVGGGISDFDLDYGQSRRMIGFSAWADYNIYHGLGIECEGTSIFLDKPDTLQRMKQQTIKGGAIYKYHTIFHVKPFVGYLYGLGSIDFPSGNPLYTHDTFSMSAVEGGVEVKAWRQVYVRGQYEYEWWSKYHGPHSLTPNGITVGAIYYLRGIHKHY